MVQISEVQDVSQCFHAKTPQNPRTSRVSKKLTMSFACFRLAAHSLVDRGQTALDIARSQGHLEVIKLLEAGWQKSERIQKSCLTFVDIPLMWVDFKTSFGYDFLVTSPSNGRR